MKASSFGYLSRQGVKSLWSNRMMTLASVGVLTACLLIVGVAVLLTENINEVVKYVEAQNEFKAFMYKEDEYLTLLNDEAAANGQTAADPDQGNTAEPQSTLESGSQDDASAASDLSSAVAAEGDVSGQDGQASQQTESVVSAAEDTPVADAPLYTSDNFDWDAFTEEVTQKIRALPNVESAEFISKDIGIEQMKNQLGEKAQLLDDYVGAENPLNDSFTIKVKDLAQMEQTTKDVAAIQGVYTVSAANEVAETLTDVRQIINVAGWALVAALVVVSLVIIINTIRATIFSRRKELNIMRYVGATKAFIRLPFIVEGVLLGLISAGIAYLIIWQSYSYALRNLIGQSTSWLNAAMASIIPFEQIALPLALFFVVSSVFIGVLGSAVSIRNHIKV